MDKHRGDAGFDSCVYIEAVSTISSAGGSMQGIEGECYI